MRRVGSFSHIVLDEIIPATEFDPTPTTRAVQTPLTINDLANIVPRDPSLKLVSVIGTFSISSGSPVRSDSIQ